MSSALLDLLVCPACRGQLSEQAGQYLCMHCRAVYPTLGGVPCLLPEPDRFRASWRQQLAELTRAAEETVTMFQKELRKPALLPNTRLRLETQIALTKKTLAELVAIIEPAAGPNTDNPLPAPRIDPLNTFHYLHRDWAETTENGNALACVERVLDDAPLGRLLVLGAGAGRLAYDLHRTRRASLTVALDIDPLVALVAQQMISGGRIELTEARSNATEMTRFGALRTLQAPAGPVERFHVLLANGLQPPLRDHLFDTVLTPWFIDVVPPDLRDFMSVLSRVLVPGGRWLNYGPLLFPPSRPAAYRYAREEVSEIAQAAGFDVTRETDELVRFAYSPLAARGRLEHCIAFSAQKGPPKADAWLQIPHLPIPDFPGRAELRHESAAFNAIIELIDGRRSINDIASHLGAGASPDVNLGAMKDAVRLCLQTIHPTLELACER
jgi:uncharacterized protein YbaR (Trm112 family)/SAM-dependent methyltransferase